MNNYTFYTKKEDKLKRLDQFLKEQITDLSRNKIRSIIQAGGVKVGFKVIDDIAYPIESKRKITLAYDDSKVYAKPKNTTTRFPIQIIYEDQEVVIIDKKNGVLTAPTRKGEKDTCVHQINNYIKKKYQKKYHTTYIVNQLEQAASGLIIFANTITAQENLKRQFQEMTAKYTYEAILSGIPETKSGQIKSLVKDKLVKKDEPNEAESSIAITNYKVKKTIKDKFAHVIITLQTKMRSQIRQQFAQQNLPILGDEKFTEDKRNLYQMPRLALHVTQVEFLHPRTHKKLIFKSNLPVVMNQFINR